MRWEIFLPATENNLKKSETPRTKPEEPKIQEVRKKKSQNLQTQIEKKIIKIRTCFANESQGWHWKREREKKVIKSSRKPKKEIIAQVIPDSLVEPNPFPPRLRTPHKNSNGIRGQESFKTKCRGTLPALWIQKLKWKRQKIV